MKKTTLECFNNSPYSSIKHSTYFDVYDRLFSPYIGKKITFVEIGILNGGSLFMWRDFFGPQARIIGIDLNPEAKRWEKDGFEIYIGSQSDPEFWRETLREIGDIDVLLDDGGHTFEQQIVTVESALPAIKDGGLLVVEDTHTSYMKEFGGPCKYSFIEYAKNIVDGINYRFGELSNRKHESVIHGVLFYESFVALEVNRKKSVVSSPTKNEGKEFGAEDFRYHEHKQLNLPKKINKLIRKIRNSIKILNLRKYFLYK